jgi:hypothetical protein
MYVHSPCIESGTLRTEWTGSRAQPKCVENGSILLNQILAHTFIHIQITIEVVKFHIKYKQLIIITH